MALLDVRNLHVYYGKIHALRGVSLKVDAERIVSLIGANGAGKSTTLRAITGILASSDGEVVYEGMPVTNLPAHDIVGRGIVHIPEGRRVFSRMTVQENLRIGAFLSNDRKWIASAEERALAMFPRLRERLTQVAGTLSGGEQQMLAIARGLMSNPKVLLLDEPSMGLAPILVQQIFDTVVQISKQGVAILLVEQNAFMALRIAHYAYVIETGEIALEGEGKSLLDNAKVKEAYLG